MSNLFWKTPKRTQVLLATPFQTEHEFEEEVYKTGELFRDICFLKRQVRGGGKRGIPDIVGVDNEGTICIIELKNVEVDAEIIPQVLRYAVWAETNPDSVKTLWYECKDKPENISINWSALPVRILIVAPSIHPSTLAAVKRITVPVDLIEVKRWVEGANSFLLVNHIEPDEGSAPKRPVSGARVYDKEFYKGERNEKSVEEFLRYCHQLNAFAKAQKWNLRMQFNRFYCGFKAGFFNAFGVKWYGTRSFGFLVKLPKEEAMRLRPKPDDYSTRWKEAYYDIEPGVTKVESFRKVFEHAYRRLSGDQ